MLRILSLGLIFIGGCSTTTYDRQPTATKVHTYKQLKKILGADPKTGETRTFHGIVENAKTGEALYCQSLRFIADDPNERFDYFYKAWTDTKCDFQSTNELRILTKNRCVKETDDQLRRRTIDFDETNVGLPDIYGFRSLDPKAKIALSRCNAVPRGTGEPVEAAKLKYTKTVTRRVSGTKLDKKFKTLVIQLDLTGERPAESAFLNYVFLLDKNVE